MTLNPEEVDLDTLGQALEDHTGELRWELDLHTGEVRPGLDPPGELAEGAEEPDPDAVAPVEPVPSHVAYADMEDFVEHVADPYAQELLDRAIRGRGAFRRFKDTLLEFPELREAWFAFHRVRAQRRAVRWLVDEGLVDEAAGQASIEARPDQPPPDHDPGEEIVALELRTLQGVKERDLDMLEGLLGEDFTLTTGRPGAEVRSRAEWLEVTRTAYTLEEYAVEELTVQHYGDAAVARSRYRQRGAMGSAARDTTYRMTDVWIRDPVAGWQLQARHAQPVEGD